MYYASIGMLSITVLIIVNYEALMNAHLEKSQVAKRRYRHFLFGVIVYLLSDIFWGILYGKRLITLTYADTVIYFLSMVISVFLWTRFVVAYLKNKKAYGKFLIYAGWIITIYEVVVLIINFFAPIVFGFSEDKEYVPGRARYVTLFIQMFLFFMTSVYSFIVSVKAEDEDKRHHKTIGFSGIAMTIFIALQSLYPLMPFYAVGCLLATCMIHTFVYKDETVSYSQEIGTTKQLAYRDRDEIMRGFDADVDKNQKDGLVVIASGFSIYDPESDNSYNDVFMRADRKMYERKGYLKGRVLSENAGETVKE